jgi:hypothetical protein
VEKIYSQVSNNLTDPIAVENIDEHYIGLQQSVGKKESQYSWSKDGILYRTREIVRSKDTTPTQR